MTIATCKNEKELNRFLANNGADRRVISEIKNVRLCDGRILENRTITRTVYDLADGSTVKITPRHFHAAVSTLVSIAYLVEAA
jgi:hypothetical protein